VEYCKYIPPSTIALLTIKLSSEFICEVKVPKQKSASSLDIEKQIPWGFFDGECQ
jgi:hypothetical protein